MWTVLFQSGKYGGESKGKLTENSGFQKDKLINPSKRTSPETSESACMLGILHVKEGLTSKLQDGENASFITFGMDTSFGRIGYHSYFAFGAKFKHKFIDWPKWTRGVSLFRKSARDSFTTKGFLRIFGGFFLETKGFLPKVYERFWEWNAPRKWKCICDKIKKSKVITLLIKIESWKIKAI